MGSNRQYVDALGVVLNETDFGSFGNIVDESNPSAGIRQGFTSRELERSIGLYWNRARWYDPAVGRFISEDPIRFSAGDPNLNRYTGNSPVAFVDRGGLKTISIGFVSDNKTAIACCWNGALADYSFEINPKNPNWRVLLRQLYELLYKDVEIDTVIISGHGSMANLDGVINQGHLEKPDSDQHEFFEVLGGLLGPNGKIDLRFCEVAKGADGKKFIETIADITEAEVHAIDDWYAIWPYGTEWKATPGNPATPCACRGPYQGSWVQKQNDKWSNK